MEVPFSADAVLSALHDLFDQLVSRVSSRPALSAGAVAAFLIACRAYKAFGRIRAKSLVRGLPGPENPSWLEGACRIVHECISPLVC